MQLILSFKISKIEAYYNLLKSKRSGNYSAIICAIDALAEIGDNESLPILIRMFDIKNSTVDKKTINALGNIADKRSLPFLKDILYKYRRYNYTHYTLEVRKAFRRSIKLIRKNNLGSVSVFDRLYFTSILNWGWCWWHCFWATVTGNWIFGGIFYFIMNKICHKKFEKLREKYEAEFKKEGDKLDREIEQAKSEFFSNVSHELRTPLTNIIPPVELCLSQQGKNLAPKVRNILHGILLNSKKLLKEINKLLDISKLEAGKMRFKYALTDINGLLNIVIEPARELAKAKRITLLEDYASDVEEIYVDMEYMSKTFSNLLNNA